MEESIKFCTTWRTSPTLAYSKSTLQASELQTLNPKPYMGRSENYGPLLVIVIDYIRLYHGSRGTKHGTLISGITHMILNSPPTSKGLHGVQAGAGAAAVAREAPGTN